MKYKGIAIPSPSQGRGATGKKIVVPDQSMSLKEILTRFVKHESLPVAHKGVYGSDGEIDPESESEFNIDQEKAKHWDLTEKQEFRDKVAEYHEEFEKSRREKAQREAEEKAKKEKAEFDKKVRIAARKYAKENPGNPGRI